VRPFETRGAIEKNPQSRFDLLSEFSGTISRGEFRVEEMEKDSAQGKLGGLSLAKFRKS